jgi:membrane peptidoglycan carboxypeptidase
LDRHGEVLWEIFGEGKRTNIPLSQMPEHLIEATIAVEDDTFYENIGLDAPSLMAAIVANLRNPDDRPVGGSTITQQLVRHIAFDYDERTAVSYERKLKEIFLAWIMNRNFSKDEVLEMYLNEIYYGNLAYGIEAAANTYYGKPAAELSLAEASLLAALPQSPVELDPFSNLEGAKARQWLVLNLMVSEGAITKEQAEAAYLEPLQFAAQEVGLAAPHSQSTCASSWKRCLELRLWPMAA